jgi:hypothetical protein
MITQLAPQLCPQCSHLLDAHTNTEGDGPPCEGDVSVCIECASVLIFDADLKVLLISIDELPEDCRPQVSKVVELMKQFHREVPRSATQTS